jgi:lysophospholipase L1-like esterase
MFTKRRKSSLFSDSRDRSRYGGRRRSIPTPWLIASVPLALLALELLLRVGVGIAGKGAELDAYEGEPAIVTDYRFKPVNAAKQAIQGLPGAGRLVVQSHPLTGYQLLPDQKNTAVQVNPQGFRNEGAIAPVKPKNEVRILVIGGSTAFGEFSQNNQATFAHKLENRLNQQVQEQKAGKAKFQPDVLPYFADELEKVLKLPPKIREANYRVINAAVPGYVSANTLADLSSRLMQYQPDAIVLIDGYADLIAPTQEIAASLGTEEHLSNAFGHLFSSLGEGVKGAFNWFYITKAMRYWAFKPEPEIEQLIDPLHLSKTDLADRFAAEPQDLAVRVDRYHRNLKQIATLAHSAKVPTIVAIQPELSQRPADKQTEDEKQRLSALGENYTKRVQAGYQALQKPLEDVQKVPGTGVIKLQPAIDRVEGDAFQDTIHLTNNAHEAVANRLYEAIVPKLRVEPKPFAGTTL